MPLARIFTHHPERTAALSSQLQEQGYTVEVASPEQAHLPPADLEIEFEICERADVLERAADLADELQADVAVAPGVIQPSAKAGKNVPVYISSAVPQAVEPPAPPPTDREREFEAAFSAAAEIPGEEQRSPVVEIPVMQRAPLPPVAFADESPAPSAEVAAKPADPVPYLAQLTPFGTPSVDAEIQGAALRLENSPGREPVRPSARETESSAPRHSFWLRLADVTARAVTSVRAIAAATAASFREQAQEYRKKAQVRSAEARAAHEARLLDLEQRRAEAQQRAEELEAAREAAASRLVELVRERDPGLKEEILQEQSAREEILHEQDHAANVVESPAPSRIQAWRQAVLSFLRKPRQPMTPQLRAVLTGAAAVSALFLIGIILGSMYPRTPLAKPADQSSGGVTVQSSGPPTKRGGVTVKASGPPTQAAPAQATQPAAGVVANSPTPQPEKPSPRGSQTQRIAAQQGESAIGDDVVIRHFKRPVPMQKPRQTGQQAGLKHFSDLEN